MLSYTASKTSKLAKEVYFRTDSATDDRHSCLRLVDGRLSRTGERDKALTTDDLTNDIKSCIYVAPLILVHI
jgi:hypothetical protein